MSNKTKIKGQSIRLGLGLGSGEPKIKRRSFQQQIFLKFK